MLYTTALLAVTAGLATARDVPANLKSYYDSHKTGKCPNPISITYKDGVDGKANNQYCADTSNNIIYIKGTDGAFYADMDIDCDGTFNGQGKCKGDGSGQSQTAFMDTVKKFGIPDLDAHIHNYVVLGNDNSKQEGTGGEKFDPQKQGVKPLSIVAMVCNNKLVYGVWGDINGGDVTGEASLSVGQMCFGDDAVSGNNGHGERDVLYIAFKGDDAVIGDKANWKAKTKEDFEKSLAAKGDALVAKIGGGSAKSTGQGDGNASVSSVKATATSSAKKSTKTPVSNDESENNKKKARTVPVALRG